MWYSRRIDYTTCTLETCGIQIRHMVFIVFRSFHLFLEIHDVQTTNCRCKKVYAWLIMTICICRSVRLHVYLIYIYISICRVWFRVYLGFTYISQKPKARWSQSEEPSEAEAKRSYFPAFISRSMEYVVQLSLCIFFFTYIKGNKSRISLLSVTWSSSKQYSQEPSEAKTKHQKPGEAKAKSQVKPKSQKPDYVFSWLIEEIRGHRKPKTRSQVKPKPKANSQSEAKAKSHGPKKLNAKKPKANNQKPITKSQEPKWSQKLKAKRKPEQSQKPKSQNAKSQKAKWALEAKSQVGAQMRDPSSKMHAKHRF